MLPFCWCLELLVGVKKPTIPARNWFQGHSSEDQPNFVLLHLFFSHTLGGTQGLFLAVGSGITPGSVHGTIWGAREKPELGKALFQPLPNVNEDCHFIIEL